MANFLELPDEVIVLISLYLERQDFAQLLLVCHRLNAIKRDAGIARLMQAGVAIDHGVDADDLSDVIHFAKQPHFDLLRQVIRPKYLFKINGISPEILNDLLQNATTVIMPLLRQIAHTTDSLVEFFKTLERIAIAAASGPEYHEADISWNYYCQADLSLHVPAHLKTTIFSRLLIFILVTFSHCNIDPQMACSSLIQSGLLNSCYRERDVSVCYFLLALGLIHPNDATPLFGKISSQNLISGLLELLTENHLTQYPALEQEVFSLIRELRSIGWHIDLATCNDQTPLEMAILNRLISAPCFERIVDLLVELGLDLAAKKGYHQDNALLTAARNSRNDAVATLIKKDCRLTQGRDKDGNSLLHLICRPRTSAADHGYDEYVGQYFLPDLEMPRAETFAEMLNQLTVLINSPYCLSLFDKNRFHSTPLQLLMISLALVNHDIYGQSHFSNEVTELCNALLVYDARFKEVVELLFGYGCELMNGAWGTLLGPNAITADQLIAANGPLKTICAWIEQIVNQTLPEPIEVRLQQIVADNQDQASICAELAELIHESAEMQIQSIVVIAR